MLSDGEPLFSDQQWDNLETRLNLPLRQCQVIRKLFEGCSDKQIAQEVGVALPTVRSHLRRIYTKFDVQDRTELVLFIVREFIHTDGNYCDDMNSDVHLIDQL